MPIVTDGLLGYYNYKQGLTSTSWQNIAPGMSGQHDVVIDGAIPQANGLYLDGVDDEVGVNLEGSPSYTGGYTIECMVSKQKDTYSLLYQGYDGIEGTTFQVALDTSTSTRGVFVQLGTIGGTSVTYEEVSGLGGIQLNRTYHIAVTIQHLNPGYKVAIYVDGVKKREATRSYNLDNRFGDVVVFGGQVLYSSSKLQGLLKSYRMYTRPLTDAEIQQNYAVGEEIGLASEPTPVIVDGAASMASTSSLSATGEVVKAAPTITDGLVSISGTTSMQNTASRKLSGSSTSNAISSVSSSSSKILQSSVSTAGVGGTSATPVRTVKSSISSIGSSDMSSQGRKYLSGISSLLGDTSMQVEGQKSMTGDILVDIIGAGDILISGEKILSGVLGLYSSSSLSGSGRSIKRGTTAISAGSQTSIRPVRVVSDSLIIIGTGSAGVFQAKEVLGSLAIHSSVDIEARGVKATQSSLGISAVGDISSQGIRTISGITSPQALSGITLHPIRIMGSGVGIQANTSTNTEASMLLSSGITINPSSILGASASVALVGGTVIESVSNLISSGLLREIPGIELEGLLDGSKELLGMVNSSDELIGIVILDVELRGDI